MSHVVELVDRLRQASAKELTNCEQLLVLVLSGGDEVDRAEVPQQPVAMSTRDHHIELIGEAGVQDGVGL